MDKATMVEPTLTKELIDAGETLVRRLDEGGFNLDVALWLYSSEADGWKLVLAEAKVATKGPRAIYQRIQRVLKKLPDDAKLIDLEDVALMRTDAPIVTLLRTAVKTGRGVSGMRFTNNVINGNLIEDAYIYRVA